MNHIRKTLRSLGAAGLLAAGSVLLTANFSPVRAADETPPAPEPVGFLIRTNYHGWADAILLSNGRVEAVIVPAIGRMMQFRFSGETDGPFWENESLYGKPADAQSTNWLNFGGSKVWPAPMTDWKDVLPRGWPPPAGFDASPCEVRLDGFVVTLISPVDPHFGIRVRREIALALDDPVITIATTFEKVRGRPLRVSVWEVAQLKDPLLIYTPLGDLATFREHFVLQSGNPPPSLRIQNGGLTLTRNPKEAHKIGTDSGTLVWVSGHQVLRMDSPRLPLAKYPDQGSSAEISTSPDPLPYVELETLGPLTKLKVGERTSHTTRYTLLRRTEADPELEARKLLLR